MKAVLKRDYDYELNKLDDDDDVITFKAGIEYPVIHKQAHKDWVGGDVVVIINEDGCAMSVSSHPNYVTLIEDDQELITKLRYDGIEHVEINKQGE